MFRRNLQPLSPGQTVLSDPQTCGPNYKESHCRRPHLNVYWQENLKFHINGEINIHFTEQEISKMVYIAGGTEQWLSKNSKPLVWDFWCDDNYGNAYIWKYYSRDVRKTPWNVLHWLNTWAPTCTCASICNHVCPHTHTHIHTNTFSTTSFKTSSSITYTTVHTPNPPWTVMMFISCSVLYSWKLLHQGSNS
jgi:hypothetical protein